MNNDSIITGTVIDSNTKRAIADAVVSVTSSSLQGEQTVLTDKNGAYRIANLFSGTYTIQVEAEGYKPYSRSSLNLKTDETRKVNITLSSNTVKAEL